MKKIKILKVEKPIKVIGVADVFSYINFENGKMLFIHYDDNTFSDEAIEIIATTVYTQLQEMGFSISNTMQKTEPLFVVTKNNSKFQCECNKNYFSYEDSLEIGVLVVSMMNNFDEFMNNTKIVCRVQDNTQE